MTGLRRLYNFGAGCTIMMGMMGCDGVSPSDVGQIIDIIDNGNDNSIIDDIVDIIDNGNDNADDTPIPTVALSVFATNTGGASGIAWNPIDDALYAVNEEGLYGPIVEDDDLLEDTPLVGATNLSDEGIFDQPTSSLVLAVADAGDFWIGSTCCQTMATVSADGGDAEPFLGLFSDSEEFESVTIFPDTLAIIPDSFAGQPFSPGDLLIGEETSFDRMGTIDVDGDLSAVNVTNPSETMRDANHLTFGLDGVLYAATGIPTIGQPGIQTIDDTGAPTALPGTESVGAESLIALANGDLIIRGSIQDTGALSRTGILRYIAADQEIELALELSSDDRSVDDELIVVDGPNGPTIFLSLPNRNEILTVSVIDDD